MTLKISAISFKRGDEIESKRCEIALINPPRVRRRSNEAWMIVSFEPNSLFAIA